MRRSCFNLIIKMERTQTIELKIYSYCAQIAIPKHQHSLVETEKNSRSRGIRTHMAERRGFLKPLCIPFHQTPKIKPTPLPIGPEVQNFSKITKSIFACYHYTKLQLNINLAAIPGIEPGLRSPNECKPYEHLKLRASSQNRTDNI